MSCISERFVDRDMVMRYHPGLAVGHTYCQQRTPNSAVVTEGDANTGHSDSEELENISLPVGPERPHDDLDNQSIAAGSDESMDSMDRGWANEVEYQNCAGQESEGEDEIDDDDEYIALHEMYEAD